MTRRTVFNAFACYLAVILLVVGFAVLRVRTVNRFAAQVAPDSLPYGGRTLTPPDEHARPFFSVQTNRTYATTDRARLWVNYRGVDALDFRVYRVKDPVKFFRGLETRIRSARTRGRGRQVYLAPADIFREAARLQELDLRRVKLMFGNSFRASRARPSTRSSAPTRKTTRATARP